jgi:Cellulase (glycosyl hydrolase family 5)
MIKRVPFLVGVVVLLARAGWAAGTNAAVVPSPTQPLAWIRTSADQTHFVREGTGHPFVPWGFNYDRDDAGRLLEDYWAGDWTKVTNDFHEMKSLGANVVRIHLQLCRFMKSPDQPNEENLARLGKLVRLAETTGVYLDVTGLGCYRKQDVPPWYDAMDESDRWKVQARFWQAVAGVCQGSSAIFCYDLMNEPIPSGNSNDDWLPGKPLDGKNYVQRLTIDMQGRTEQEIAKEWITEMCAAIRAVDKRHLITVGVVPWEETFGPGAKSPFCDPDVSAELDFLCVHYYPRQGKLEEDLGFLERYDTGKPLVLEEIYPLSADVETTEEFMRRSRTDANGWISFYWGKTPEEYDQEAKVSSSWDGESDKDAGIKAAVAGNWLRHFTALRGEMTGGPVSTANRTNSPPSSRQ